MDVGHKASDVQLYNMKTEENGFTHDDGNDYTHRKFILIIAIIYNSSVAYHRISEVIVRTDKEIYQHPILRKKDVNNIMLRNQLFAAGMNYGYIVCYNVSEKE